MTAVNSAGESIVSNEDSAYSDYPLLKMFVTSATGTGDLSSWDIDGWSPTEEGMAAGDEICQHLATEAGLAGTFKAWLSDSTTDAYCHIHNLTGQKVANCGEDSLPVTAGPWVRTDGQPFSEKIDQTLSPNYKIYTSPMYDELGNKIVTSYAFTGSSAAGTLDAYPNCLDWSSHDGGTNGAAGNTDRTGAFWTLGLYNACNSLNGIYCFQVDQGRALPPFASDGKKVFVTSVTGTGDLGGWPQSDG